MKKFIEAVVSDVSGLNDAEFYLRVLFWDSELSNERTINFGPYKSERTAKINGLRRWETYRLKQNVTTFRLPKLPYKRILLR